MLAGAALSETRLERARSALLAQAAAALGAIPERARVRYELRYLGQAFELPVDEELGGDGGVGEPAATVPVPVPGRRGADRADPSAGLGPVELRAAFAEQHERRYGYRDEDAEVELVNLRVSVWAQAPPLVPRAARQSADASRRFAVPETAPVVFAGESVETSVHRGEPAPGDELAGPALVAMRESTLLIAPGWQGAADDHGTIRLRRRAGA
jgi:N-methylhydantoinase A